MTLRRSLLTLLVVTCCAVSAFAQYSTTATGTSTTTYTPQFSFPPAGLAATETAQINVVNVASNSSSGTAASCTGTITFLDSAGATIGSAASFTVTAGQLFSASLPYSSVGSSGRVQIRGEVQWSAPSSSAAPCSLLSSFETFDTDTGVTHLLLGGVGGSLGGPGPGH